MSRSTKCRPRKTGTEVRNIVSRNVIFILICGIIVLVAAFMNFFESHDSSFSKYILFLSAILILAVAGMLHAMDQKSGN